MIYKLKAWCSVTKMFEFTSVDSDSVPEGKTIEEVALTNLVNKVKFKKGLYFVTEKDFRKVLKHLSLSAYKFLFCNKGSPEIAFQVYVIAKSLNQARFYLLNRTVCPRKILAYDGEEDIKSLKSLYPEEDFKEGSIIHV